MEFRDYHVHLERGPFTIEWIEKFLEVGKRRGIIEIGFSEHGHRFKEAAKLIASKGFRGKWTSGEATESIEDYIKLVEKAKDMGLPVKLGIEMDYIPEYEKEIGEFIRQYPFDYVLGSVHWLGDFGFDHPDLIDKWDNLDIDKVYVEYFNTLLSAVKSGIFDVIAHPDVIKVFGHKAKGDMSKHYKKLAKAMKDMDLCAEVSTAGLRKPVGEIYPSPQLMECFYDYKVPIMLNSDAHIPEDIGRDFDKAVSFIKNNKYNDLCYFEKRIRKTMSIKSN